MLLELLTRVWLLYTHSVAHLQHLLGRLFERTVGRVALLPQVRVGVGVMVMRVRVRVRVKGER